MIKLYSHNQKAYDLAVTMLKDTKKAVAEGKSVNSIIKLLSITNPASLKDASNFGDREYFQILMSEIAGIKNEMQKKKN